MNTTVIIILGVLILIVVIAIVAVLVKGKSSTSNPDDSSDITFQEVPEVDTQDETPEPELVTPTLHAQNNPPIDNLTTPQQTPSVVQPSSVPQPEQSHTEPNLNQPLQPQQAPISQNTPTDIPTQGSGIYQPNPLPDPSQIQSDMANLQGTQSTPGPIPTTPPSVETNIQPDIQNIADSINQVQIQEEEQSVKDMGFNPPIEPQPIQQSQTTDNSSMNQNPPVQQPPISN